MCPVTCVRSLFVMSLVVNILGTDFAECVP
jgi:hypothetical protein